MISHHDYAWVAFHEGISILQQSIKISYGNTISLLQWACCGSESDRCIVICCALYCNNMVAMDHCKATKITDYPEFEKISGDFTCYKLFIKTEPQIYYQIIGLVWAVCQSNESHSNLSWGLHERVGPTVHYFINSCYGYMVDHSKLSSVMYTIKFRISVKCQFSCN